MDDLLPSYESAIKQDPWELVAGYLPSDDLCSAALVCQRWHEIFTPQLWGNPASHFGVQNDTVYVALTRFKRTLYWSRLCVREMTHTLHLPPAHAEIYGGPHSEWLRDCLERLPRLQCLIVNGLPFFDHGSLLTLRHSSLWWRQTHPNAFPVYGLRLLDASACSNATSTGLAEALPHFPDLVSLDLSRTSAAKDVVVLSQLKHLRNLRVLKLRSLGLRDTEFSIITAAIGTRVRSLDLSDNQLTDSSARLLLQHSVKENHLETHTARSPRPPVEHTRPAGEFGDYGIEDLDGHLRKKLTRGFVGSLAIEEARDLGITHLYLSNNCMTVEGVSGLLRSKRLQVLDIGTLPTALKNPRQSFVEEDLNDLPLPGVEKLTPVLADFASQSLSYLRVNYRIVTEDASVECTPISRAELGGSHVPFSPSDAGELPAADSLQPELDSNDTTIYELLGDTAQPKEMPASSLAADGAHMDEGASPDICKSPIPETEIQAPSIEVTVEIPEIKRGPAYAPEPVRLNDLPLSPLSPVLDASGGLSPIAASHDNCQTAPVDNSIGQASGRSRHDSTSYIEGRRACLDLRQAEENRLHPGMLPKLHTLVLTDVPMQTDDQELIRRLIQFIKDCAEEWNIAKTRAQHTYMLPPGRSRKVAEREYARTLFAMKRIILEMEPPQVAPKKITSSWRAYPTKSSTEDADSEAFWEAATHDFSFFGDEECGLPNAELGSRLPLAMMDGLMLAPRRPAAPPKPRQPESTVKPVLEVVAEIGKFRKDRKAAYMAATKLGDPDPSVEGYWPGDITVIHKSVNADSGNLDYYGNRFEAGWYYR